VRPCPTCGFKLWPTGKVRHIRFHDLRHTYASVLLMFGANLVSVQKLLGHSDPKITERRYGHLLPNFMRAEVDRLRFGLGALLPEEADKGALQAGTPSQASHALASEVRPFGIPLVSSRGSESTEAGTPGFSPGIPASWVAGCRGLEPLASGVTVASTRLAGGSSASQPLGTTGTGRVFDSPESQGSTPVFRSLGIPLVSSSGSVLGRTARLLTVREAAAAMRVAPATVYQLCAEARLPHVRISNAIRIPCEAIAWMGMDFEPDEGPGRGPRRSAQTGLPSVDGALFLAAGAALARRCPERRRVIRAWAGLQAALADSLLEPTFGDVQHSVARGA